MLVLTDPYHFHTAHTDVQEFLKWQQMGVMSQVWWPGSSATDSCCTVPRTPTLGSLLHPHPPLWGVHAFPAFLECCLSTPSSTKEMLTAINYHTGWTKGIPLCWNIGVHRRTHAHVLISPLRPHTKAEAHHLASIGLHHIWQMSWNVLSSGVVQSPSSLAECVLWAGTNRQRWGCNDQAPRPGCLSNLKHTHTHTTLAKSCLCVCGTRFYETTLWWSAQILTFDEKHAEDLSSLSELSSKSVFRHLSYTLYSAEACLLFVCMKINLQYWLEIGHSLLIQARTEPLTVSAARVSKAPASTLNPMWFSCRRWPWCRGGRFGPVRLVQMLSSR